MESKKEIDLRLLEIFPLLNKVMLRGIFKSEDSEFTHLVSWIKTMAWHSQLEKKSKTYLASYDGEVVAYINLSSGSITKIDGEANSTKFEHQALLIGKLYVAPNSRSHGIGNELLSFAVGLAANLNEIIGCIGVIVDSNNNKKTVSFYKKFGFKEIESDSGEHAEIKMFFKLPE